MDTAVLTGPHPDVSVATADGAHRTVIVNSYVFWAECSCGWKGHARGSHTFARDDARAHRAENER